MLSSVNLLQKNNRNLKLYWLERLVNVSDVSEGPNVRWLFKCFWSQTPLQNSKVYTWTTAL